jgi:uncharacterized protein with PIN domain
MEITKAGASERPICPHCKKELDEVKAKQFDKGFFKVTEKYVYFCPHCKMVLGVGQSAWMP